MEPRVPKAGNVGWRAGYGQPPHLGPKVRWSTEQAALPKVGEQTEAIKRNWVGGLESRRAEGQR